MNTDITEHGVCRLSMIPIRSEASDKSEIVTQLLFGEHYEVLVTSKDKKWLRIRNYFDQYEGWLDTKQHHCITKEYFDYINRADFKITTDITTSILYNKNPIPIVMGSVIPISGAELFKMEEQFAFNGESKSMGQKRDVEFLKLTSQKYLNAPYQWGGKSPFGIDCSGLTQMVFKINGYKLQRDASQQAKQGKPVEYSDCQPGDLVFFKNKESNVSHVGMLLAKDRIIHASGKVRVDYFNEAGILQSETKIYSHTSPSVRRVF